MTDGKQPEGILTEPIKPREVITYAAMVEAPARLNECWDWFSAVWAFDYGDPEPLSALVRSCPIPIEFQNAIADIISGKRKPNRKASAKVKIPPSERAKLAATLSVMFDLLNNIKWRAWETDDLKPGAITIADRLGTEPIEVLQSLKTEREKIIATACQSFGVSSETLENLMREARDRIAKWPTV